MIYKTSTLITSDNWLNRSAKEKQMTDGQLVGFYKWMLKNDKISVDGAAYKRMLAIERRRLEVDVKKAD